uniref:Zyxin n=1 Tax=Monopterus albus TaxID=43700 RepID=A0A3Q3KRT0_MONAL
MLSEVSSGPFLVTSSLNFKVTTPSFYNQPKKFAPVAPPRPKSQTPPSAPSPTPVGTGVIGRVGDLPPPPSSLSDAFPPPPPPLDDDLPAPPPECHPTTSDVPPPTFPAPPPEPTEMQMSFNQQLDSLTDLLSEMETRGPFNPKLPSQYSSASAPKPSAPPPTAPKPALSFLPPAEMGDRPPPAPWAEELKARTNRQANHSPAANAAAQPFAKAPAVAPKSGFGGKTATSSASLAQKLSQNLNQTSTPISGAPKTSAPSSSPLPPPKSMEPPASFRPPTKAPPASSPSFPGPVAVPGGGVPLSMREVEELERMTKDFIKDMDTHAPVITSPPTEVCGKCGEALSRSQPAVRAMDKLFHSNCFCCMSCHRPLQGMQFYDRDGSPQCESCYISSLAVCSRCGDRITDRVLKAVGQCFHAHCFRCSTCSCTLEGAPFITDDNNNPYCVQDYHRRFSPLCVSCNEPIVPAPGSEETVRVVALDKNFHLKCYRCEDCARPLSIEADENGCYPLDGRILCMKCHTKRAKQAAQ